MGSLACLSIEDPMTFPFRVVNLSHSVKFSWSDSALAIYHIMTFFFGVFKVVSELNYSSIEIVVLFNPFY